MFTIRYRTFQSLANQREDKIDTLRLSNTFSDLIEAICRKEKKGPSAQLYLPSGIPLNRNLATEKWTLEDWHVRSGDLFLVIFCSKEYSLEEFSEPVRGKVNHKDGPQHLVVQGLKSCKVRVDLEIDSPTKLYQKVYSATEIPTNWMELWHGGKLIEGKDDSTTLSEWGLEEGEVVQLKFCPQRKYSLWHSMFNAKLCKPRQEQSSLGLSAFNSMLYVISYYVGAGEMDLKVLGRIMELTACPPLVHALAALFSRRMITMAQKVAINEGLFELFHCMSPEVRDQKVFEQSKSHWGHIYSTAQSDSALPCDFTHTISFFCSKCEERVDQAYDSPDFGIMCYKCAEESCQQMPPLSPYVSQLLVSMPLDTEAAYWDLVAGGPGKPPYSTWPKLASPGPPARGKLLPPYLEVKSTNDLMHRPDENPPPCVFRNGDNQLVVCTGRSKDDHERDKTHFMLDPLTGNEQLCDLKRISFKLQLTTVGSLEKHSYITEAPDEAVVVLLDKSGSMGSNVLPRTTRLDFAKLVFTVFADRTMAFNLKHAIGLTAFNHESTVVTKLSEAGEAIVHVMKQKTDALVYGGGTALWHSIEKVAAQLLEVKAKYPNCLLRVFCLSDGCDFSSSTHCIALLRRQNIVLDFVIIGDDNQTAKQAAIETGGHAFHFEEIVGAMKIMEMEAVLSIRQRSGATARRTSYSTSISVKLPPEVTRKTNALMPVNVLLSYSHKPAHHARIKRILQELANIVRNPLDGVHVYPVRDRVDFWRIILCGPSGSMYEKGTFLLYAVFPEKYPNAPPEIRFQTPIYHCNVTADGLICHPKLLRYGYSATLTIRDLLNEVKYLLKVPNPIDAIDSHKGLEFMLPKGKDSFAKHASEHTLQHAKQTVEELCMDLTGKSEPPSISANDEDILDEAWFMM